MEAENCIIKIPGTPEYILGIFRDLHRHACAFDPGVDPDAKLTFETTIEEFRNACDLLGSRQLGHAYNAYFGLDFDRSQWNRLLEPAAKRTLQELCTEIAKHTYQEKITPLHIFGMQCFKGGIFVALKSKLAQAGANVEELAPSSELAEYARLYPMVFIGFSGRFFPDILPEVRISKPLYDLSITGILISLLVLLMGWLWGPLLSVLGVLMFLFFYGAIFFAAKRPAKSVRFGELKTFRDLVEFIAKHNNSEK